MTMREALKDAKRIVVKVGTSTLTHETGKLNYNRMESLVRELADLGNQGKEIVLVTSAAIAAGMDRLGLSERPAGIPEKQALAAIGQGILMNLYEKFFAEYGKIAAQVLLTRENSARHNQYSNCRNALAALLRMGAVPIINENDAIAVDEIKIGDNDTLSAIVAMITEADLLVILSDIDGLYTDNPQTNKNAKFIDEIKEITPEVERMAGGAGSKLGTGGMFTKLQAAKIAMNSGVPLIIGKGSEAGLVRKILEGENIGTLFVAKKEHLNARKSWLAFGRSSSGKIKVDNGCVHALSQDGKSLLAAGVISVAGRFLAGDTVSVIDDDGREIARGIVNYTAEDLQKIIGLKTSEIASALPNGKIYDEVIHRDSMVLLI